ncbi:MAG: winged helix-turn-helix domain-containing protein [Candidatus Thorarchaeota archaeon SMTZ1-45]|nr:MAG: transcriptional regulator [Candidatus Thorarchaeota archaeon SMTZ1-45]
MNNSNDPESGPEIDRVIHEPSRLRIMAQLYVVESADFIFLMNQLGLTWGNLSSHMSKLEEAEYIEVQKEFLGKKPHTILKLTLKGREAFMKYRNAIEKVLKDIPS